MNVRTGTDLGAAIAMIRVARRFSQADLADMSGLDASYISKIETGRTSSILEHELRILRRLGAIVTVELPDADR